MNRPPGRHGRGSIPRTPRSLGSPTASNMSLDAMGRYISLPLARRAQAMATGRVTAGSGTESVWPGSHRGRPRCPGQSKRSRSSVIRSRRLMARQCVHGGSVLPASCAIALPAIARGCIRSSSGFRFANGNGFASPTLCRRRLSKPQATSSSSNGTRSHTHVTLQRHL